MTAARSTKIDLNATPFYHCISRCVRRTFLCGVDKETGVDYSHRKKLIVARMKQLANIFAIQICAYAVMSNHYHLVIYVNENQANSWSESEVKNRWSMLHPNDAKKYEDVNHKLIEDKLCEWRARLVDISWFMKCLNETMARLCNKEDDCKGHFWEARFKSQALLDETAVLAAMAYVDLNPVRAKVATTPETSEFTSIVERINAFKKSNLNKKKKQLNSNINHANQPPFLMSFIDNNQTESDLFPKIDFKLTDYLELVDATGRVLRSDKRGTIPESLPPILQRLNTSADGWLGMMKNLENYFYIGIGNVKELCEFRSQYRKHSPKGIKAAKKIYQQVA